MLVLSGCLVRLAGNWDLVFFRYRLDNCNQHTSMQHATDTGEKKSVNNVEKRNEYDTTCQRFSSSSPQLRRVKMYLREWWIEKRCIRKSSNTKLRRHSCIPKSYLVQIKWILYNTRCGNTNAQYVLFSGQVIRGSHSVYFH